jgi:hypothetical protein
MAEVPHVESPSVEQRDESLLKRYGRSEKCRVEDGILSSSAVAMLVYSCSIVLQYARCIDLMKSTRSHWRIVRCIMYVATIGLDLRLRLSGAFRGMHTSRESACL